MDSNITEAKSPSSAVQKDWTTPSDFPLCPLEISDSALLDYFNNLSKGELLTENVYGGSRIVDFAINQDRTYIWVLCKSTVKEAVKPWALTGIYVENGKFVH